MSSEFDQLIQLGHDITSMKYYMVATGAILFYDHLLTLADEIKYFWSGKKKWTFWLFIFNRYFPMTYQFWQLALSYNPYSNFNAKVCDKTEWYSILTFVICTFLAQVVLTARVYAVTLKNGPITTGFAVITVSQFVLGLCAIIIRLRKGVQESLPIPLDAYRLCAFSENRIHNIAFMSISLFYDSLAFLLVIFMVVKLRAQGLKVPTILGIIAKDATQYFLVIFTAHLVLAATLFFGRETIRLLPAPGLLVYLPVMVSRIMISLRKAADPQRGDWSLVDPPANGVSLRSMRFARPQTSTTEGRDNASLGTSLAV